MKQTPSIRLFISYSHEDDVYRNQLEKHLTVPMREGTLKVWSDRQIEAGQEWKQSILDNIENSDIILLLISPDFLASEFCFFTELKRAMERHEVGEARVIPIFLRSCSWKGQVFGKLEGVPDDAKPISRWEDRDEAFTRVTDAILNTAKELAESKARRAAEERARQEAEANAKREAEEHARKEAAARQAAEEHTRQLEERLRQEVAARQVAEEQARQEREAKREVEKRLDEAIKARYEAEEKVHRREEVKAWRTVEERTQWKQEEIFEETSHQIEASNTAINQAEDSKNDSKNSKATQINSIIIIIPAIVIVFLFTYSLIFVSTHTGGTFITGFTSIIITLIVIFISVFLFK